MKETIITQRKAHFYTQKCDKDTQSILMVLHGYGQLASDFIHEFKYLKSTSTVVIAPEALSKFYNKDKKAVANWMTAHERLDEIEDYVFFLNKLYMQVQLTYPKLPIMVLGFSQGVSTLMRWISQLEKPPQEIFLCSGSIPPELTISKVKGLKNITIHYQYGNNDRLLRIEKAKEQIDFLKRLQLTIHPFEFEGKHHLSKELHDKLRMLSLSFEK